jgi:putative inorganic carbon (HCO3(-)) transporter
MLRTIFVLALALLGASYALSGSFYILLVYLWIAYFRPESWVWHPFVQSLNLSLLTGIGLIGSVVISREVLRLNLRSLLLIVFLAHTAVSLAFSGYASSDLVSTWLNFVKSAIITYFISLLASDWKKARLVLVVIALSLGFEGAKQGWVQLIINPGGKNSNEIPHLGDNNGVAVAMAMLVSILMGLAASARSTWERRIHLFLAAGSSYRGIVTYSRGGFLSFLAMLFVQIARSRRRLQAVCFLAAVSLLILPALPDAFWNRMSTITAEGEQRDDSAASRLHFWRVAVVMANEHPLVGVGHGAYNVAFNDYDFLDGRYGRNRSVHSMWFGVLAELGYVGMALFVANLVAALLACRRLRRLSARDPASAHAVHFATALEPALAAYIVGGSFVPVHFNEMLWHLLGAAAALNTIASRREVELEAERARQRLGDGARVRLQMDGARAPGSSEVQARCQV